MAARILGPLIVCGIMFLGMHFFCLTVIPQMREMFRGFGVSLPMITEFTFLVGSFFEYFGYAGLFAMIALFGGGLVVLYLCLISARWMETISSIPWLGMSARWLLQARMARMLSVLLRNNADPAMAVQVAADSSESRTARTEGLKLAKMIREGSSETAYSQLLSGLPLSMLFHISDSTASEGDRQQASQSFSLYADALERAASGNGVLFGLIVELAAVTLSALLIGFVVISFFAPLIQLLNDLGPLF
jgi:type II secretory pathway component PulF